MPLSEAPLSELYLLFLVVFVLIGLQPALQKGARKISKLLEKAGAEREKLAPSDKDVHAAIFADHGATHALNDFEIIVLQRLSRLGNKAASSGQINETLLFGDAVLKRTLWSLHRRGLVSLRISKLLGPRFMLSESGRRHALEQGYLVELQERAGLVA